MTMFYTGDNLKRLLLAEFVRQQLAFNGEPDEAARLVKVTGWTPEEVERYPGTTSCWVENYINIYWIDADENFEKYVWCGDDVELTAALEQMVEKY